MKQKVEIQVAMNDDKSRSKAMKIAVGMTGVESAALKGPEKNKIEVAGDGIDAVQLTTLLRKNVGFAELVSVAPVKEEGGGDAGSREDKTQMTLAETLTHFYYNGGGYSHYPVYEIRQPSQDPCCIM